jgi:hypothetical protein
MSEDNTTTTAASSAEADQPVLPPTKRICPCCGQPTLARPVLKINDELLDQFMSCTITGQPFAREYPLFDGRVLVQVSQPSSDAWEKLDLCDFALAHMDGMDPNVPVDKLRSLIKALAGIDKVTVIYKGENRVFHPMEVLSKEIPEILAAVDLEDKAEAGSRLSQVFSRLSSPQNISAIPIRMLMAVNDAHAQISDILLEAGFDSNFWKGIEFA